MRHLPHVEHSSSTYFVTFRLAGSLPASVLQTLQEERNALNRAAQLQNRNPTEYEIARLNQLNSEKIHECMDSGHGDCWLRIPDIMRIVLDALLYFDDQRYKLHAWCVMPNHVHVIVAPFDNAGNQNFNFQQSFTRGSRLRGTWQTVCFSDPAHSGRRSITIT